MSIDLTFPVPPFGLTGSDFVLTPVADSEGLFTLVGGSSRLFLLDAAVHLPAYAPVLSSAQVDLLGLSAAEDAMLLVVANPAAEGTTVNLLAPVVVNARTSVGAQLILEDQDFPLRAELARR